MESKLKRDTALKEFFVTTPDGHMLTRFPIGQNDLLKVVTRYEANQFTFDELSARYAKIENSYSRSKNKAVVLRHERKYDEVEPRHFIKSERNTVDNVAFWVLNKWDNDRTTYPDLLRTLLKLGYTLSGVAEDWKAPKRKIKGAKTREIEKFFRDKKKKEATGQPMDQEFLQSGDGLLKEFKEVTGYDYI